MQTTPNELFGKKAVVTGSSSGIGRAIAIELASAGANVLVHARRSREAARGVVDEIIERGGGGAKPQKADVVMADLSEPSGQDDLIRQAWERLGRVDIWVNNAGADILTRSQPGPAHSVGRNSTHTAQFPQQKILTGEAADESFESKLEALWRVDVVATARLSRMAGERMKSQADGGVIINIGWDGAERGMGGDSGELFATAKGAVMSFSRSLAKSLAPRVRVNCLAPGWIKTAWGRQASDAWGERARRESLAGRWGTPEDVARAARFLAGPGAAFINGQTLSVNGGFKSS